MNSTGEDSSLSNSNTRLMGMLLLYLDHPQTCLKIEICVAKSEAKGENSPVEGFMEIEA